MNNIFISNDFIDSIKTNFAILANSEDNVVKNTHFLPSGFYDTYDILFLFHNKRMGYSLYSDGYYTCIDDLDYLKKLKEYEKLVPSIDEISNDFNAFNVPLVPRGLFIWDISNPKLPNKWLNFVTTFYKQFCETEKHLVLVIDYVLLILRTMLAQAPIIMNIEIQKNDYLFVGYRLHDFHKLNLVSKNLQIKIVTVKDYYILTDVNAENIDNKKYFLHSLNNMQTEQFYTDNPIEFFKQFKFELDIKKKEMQFDFVFLIPKFFLIYLMPFMFKLIIESTLRFPLLINSTELIDKEMEDDYKKIVDEEFENILYYLLCLKKENTCKSLILNNIINNKTI